MTLIQNKPISIKIGIPETGRLPAAYQEVEYIEFYGSQVISTDVNSLIAPFKVEVTYKKENTDTSDQTLVGQRQIGKFVNIYQNKYENLWSNSGDGTARADSFMHTIITDSTSGLYKDGTLLVSGTSGDKSSSYPLLIGAFSEDSYSSAKWFFKGKIYNVQITNNNILYRNYIPCYRKSDNVIGLYDLVNGNFITNLGSGTLGKGGDIKYNDKDIKYIYVGNNIVRPDTYKNIDLLIIGGGGGGGGGKGGGGGGGGFVEYNNYKLFPGEYSIGIGQGGQGGNGTTSGMAGLSGGNSYFNDIVAYGGGGGGGPNIQGTDGSSGGGGGQNNDSNTNGGSGINSQGNNGGGGSSTGGGGGGGAGSEGTVSELGSYGGTGKTSSISGTETRYSGGGGGYNSTQGADPHGGSGGGGGSGGTDSSGGSSAPTDPTTYGSGGGGGGGNYAGTSGFQGIVIVRYKTGTINATGGTITTAGEYTIHTFTENGSFIF